MTLKLLKVAVVGHTNTGKTSLLRTLTRDVSFGEVSNRAATTREVEEATLMIDGEPLVSLRDTPGLEDSGGLLERLDSIRQSEGGDWTDAIHRFLDENKLQKGFGQEAKALRQVIDCDVALYVIDARDRVHGKHCDELEILGRCARPVLPVLNFVADPEAREELWREHLARVNMHAVIAFDTVVLDEISERQLYQKMRSLMDSFAPSLEAIIAEVERRRDALSRASAELVAELLVDVAAYVVTLSSDEKPQAEAAVETMKQTVRDAEQTCVDALLALHRFRSGDFLGETLPVEDGKWGLDLFSQESLLAFGVSTGGGAVAGSLAGLAVDAMLGGITLGAAALTGAVIGGLSGAVSSHGKEVLDGLRGYTELRVEDHTLELLARRQLRLAHALLRRGHASQDRIRLSELEAQHDLAPHISDLQRHLREARHRQAWSRLAGGQEIESAGRADLIAQIAKDLLAAGARHR